VQRIWLPFPASSSLALFIGLKSRYLASFSSVAKAKAKAYFLEKQIWLPFPVSGSVQRIWLPFLASILLTLFIGLKSRYLASFSGVAKAKAKAYFFEKQRSAFLFRCR
jgi:hypothetical protein